MRGFPPFRGSLMYENVMSILLWSGSRNAARIDWSRLTNAVAPEARRKWRHFNCGRKVATVG